MPCLIYFKAEPNITPELRDQHAEEVAKLVRLKDELRRHTVCEFTSCDDLTAKVTADLHSWLFDQYLSPKLESATRGDMPRAEAEALLAAIKDLKDLSLRLRDRLATAGFNISIAGDYVVGNKFVYQTPPPAISALHQLPPPPRDFTGRGEELVELMAAVERGGVTMSGLRGQGGIGKTTLALKLAEQLKPCYPDAQFYLDLKGLNPQPLSVADVMAHVIHAYHPTAKLPETESELSGLYQSVLHNQRALLLMDNAKDRAQVEPLIPPASCVLLVTSRQHFTLPGLFAKKLDKLPPKDSHSLLLKIAPRVSDQVNEIAKLCGFLPLALRLAGSALAVRRDLTVTDYLRRLSDEQQRLRLLKGDEGDFEASISLSYELLTPEQQKLWCALAVFPDLFFAHAAAAVWDTELDQARDALGEFMIYSLVDFDESAQRYSMHDLVRLFASARLSEDERIAVCRRHAVYFKGVLEEAGKLYRVDGANSIGLILYEQSRENIRTGHAWAAAMAYKDDEAAQLSIDYPYVGADIIGMRQHSCERIRKLRVAVAAARGLKQRETEGISLGNLGIEYKQLGKPYKAIGCYEEYVAIARELGNQRLECIALGNLALAYQAIGEIQKAIDCCLQQRAMVEGIGDRRLEGAVWSNIAGIYESLGVKSQR